MKPISKVYDHNGAIAWAHGLIEIAKSMVGDGEQVPPVFFGITDAQQIIVAPVPMADDNEKNQVHEIVKLFVAHTKTNCVIMITEGWRKDPQTRERVGETVMATIASADKKDLSCILVNFTRDPANNPIWEAPIFEPEAMTKLRFFPDDITTLPWDCFSATTEGELN